LKKVIKEEMNMKKLIILFSLFISMNTAFSQSDSIDIKLQKISVEKDDNKRIDLIMELSNAETNPLLDMQFAQKVLMQSQKNKDKIIEAMALSGIGFNYRSFGNTQKSLEYNLKATALALETGNAKIVAFTKFNLAHNYKDQSDFPKAIILYLSAEESFSILNEYTMQIWALGNLAGIYLLMNKTDSALMYAQREYELRMRNQYTENLGSALVDLGSIQGKLGNSSLAISYINMAIKEGLKSKSGKQLNYIYISAARYFYDANQDDSSVVYAKKAISIVQHTAFSNLSIKPAKLLLDIYRNTNIDSAFKYSEMYLIANDSVFSSKTIQQTQLMTFEYELRQQEIASEKLKAEEQHHQNLQYTLISLGIVIFIVLFLLLSRSLITNTRLIEFFGILALLIVFEFLNLLLHPPVVMLLALVCIAAFLIPLHHRLEKWSTAKLVEKNRKIRLSMAKKTIEKLEGKTFNIQKE
jgi:hypothetical protein